MELEPLPPSAEVVRLVSHNHEHFPPGSLKPHPTAFSLTKDDEAEGKKRNLPPLLSVFDTSKTTVTQGRAIRKAQAVSAGRTGSEMTPFAWRVGSIVSIAIAGAPPALRVVADPIDEKWGPGSDGHAGIEGLRHEQGEAGGKNRIRELRRHLVDACYRVLD